MAESCAALSVLVKAVDRVRYAVILFWLVLVALGAVGAVFFIPRCILSFTPPRGTPAEAADQHFAGKFPQIGAGTQIVGFFAAEPPGQVLDEPGLDNFTLALQGWLAGTGIVSDFTSAVTLPMAQRDLVSSDGSATIMEWMTPYPPTGTKGLDFAKKTQVQFDRLAEEWIPRLAYSGILSLPTFVNVGIEVSEVSLAEMDAFALPLAFLVLWRIMKSGRLLLLPLTTMATSLAVSFGIMYLVTLNEEVEQTTPSLVMSILIAMSIDYSLFLLTRFQEEMEALLGGTARADDPLERARCVREALTKTLQTAGFTVTISCITLMTSFLAVIIFPVVMISSLGVGCSISLVVALAAHLTLGPALLLTFPVFFSSVCRCPCSGGPGAAGAGRDEGAPGDARAVDGEALVAGVHRIGHDPRTGRRCHPCWIRLARLTTAFPANLLIVFVVVAITVPVGVPVFSMKTPADQQMNIPRGTHAAEGVDRMASAFGRGYTAPYKLLLEPLGDDGAPNASMSVFNGTFWSNAQLILEQLAAKLPYTGQHAFQFPNYAEGFPVDLQTAKVCRNSSSSECAPFRYLLQRFVSEDESAMYGLISLKFDPVGNKGPAWLSEARSILGDLGPRYQIRTTLTGVGTDWFEITDRLYQFFPYMVAITLGVALLLLGLAFRSVVIPVRSIASICLTLAWVYGWAVITYQWGWFQWTGIPGLTAKFDGINSICPIVAFSVTVGICLDYDIFLLSRTTEYRELGMPANDAIQQALCSTGLIITAAGVIMAVAFSGLMFASMFPINQLSFFLVVGVLYDTFIIRTFFAPALSSLIGRFIWFPSGLSRVHVPP